MKRIIVFLSLLTVLVTPVVILPGQTLAVNVFKNSCDKYIQDKGLDNAPNVCKDVKSQQNNNASKTPDNPIIKILKGAINIISIIAGAAAIITLIVSGIRMMTASGDSNAISSARKGVVGALIGIAVIVLAQLLTIIVLNTVNP